MPWYLTAYAAMPTVPPPDPAGSLVGYYGMEIWANSKAHALNIAALRNIGEIVIGKCAPPRHARPSAMLRRKRLSPYDKLKLIHALTFLGYLAQRSLDSSPADILGDAGMIHLAIHALLGAGPKRADLAKMVEGFEVRIPGYCRESVA